MRSYRRVKRPKSIIPEVRLPDPAPEEGDLLDKALEVKEKHLRETFSNCSDVVFRHIVCPDAVGQGIRMLITYVDGLVDTKHLDEAVLQVLMRQPLPPTPAVTAAWVQEILADRAVPAAQVGVVTTYNEVVEFVLKGSVTMCVDGDEAALILSVVGWKQRGIEEPPSEPVIRGPREGFVESLRTNTAMVRR